MIKGIYDIKDELTGFTGSLMLFGTDEEATRSFKQIVKGNEMIRDNKNDYSLYKVGEYSTKIGEVTPKNEKIIGANAFIREENNEV